MKLMRAVWARIEQLIGIGNYEINPVAIRAYLAFSGIVVEVGDVEEIMRKLGWREQPIDSPRWINESE